VRRYGAGVSETTDLNYQLIHDYMLKHGEYTTPGAFAKHVGFSRMMLSKAFADGTERGWYVTRTSATKKVPPTNKPAIEYKAVPRKG
jgi:hypothetical protein